MCLCWQASVTVVVFVSNSVRTATELLRTTLDIWIISVESVSFLPLTYPLSKANCPGKGLNQLPRLVLFQEGHRGICITPIKPACHISLREKAPVLEEVLSCELQADRSISWGCEVLGEKNASLGNILTLLCPHWLAKGKGAPALGGPLVCIRLG